MNRTLYLIMSSPFAMALVPAGIAGGYLFSVYREEQKVRMVCRACVPQAVAGQGLSAGFVEAWCGRPYVAAVTSRHPCLAACLAVVWTVHVSSV
jgi:hypothetical protein